MSWYRIFVECGRYNRLPRIILNQRIGEASWILDQVCVGTIYIVLLAEVD